MNRAAQTTARHFTRRTRRKDLAEIRKGYRAPRLPDHGQAPIVVSNEVLLTVLLAVIALDLVYVFHQGNVARPVPPIATLTSDEPFATMTPEPNAKEVAPVTACPSPPRSELHRIDPFLMERNDNGPVDCLPLPAKNDRRNEHDHALANSPWFTGSTELPIGDQPANRANPFQTSIAASRPNEAPFAVESIDSPEPTLAEPEDNREIDLQSEQDLIKPQTAAAETQPTEEALPPISLNVEPAAPTLKLPESIEQFDTGDIKVRNVEDLPLLDFTRGLLDD